MKTLHDIYDGIYMANATTGEGCVMHLRQGEFELAYDGFSFGFASSCGVETIEPDAKMVDVWILPKYSDGQTIGYVMGFNISGKLKCKGAESSYIEPEVDAEIMLSSAREPWKPRLFKTVAAALKCAPGRAENVLVWRH